MVIPTPVIIQRIKRSKGSCHTMPNSKEYQMVPKIPKIGIMVKAETYFKSYFVLFNIKVKQYIFYCFQNTWLRIYITCIKFLIELIIIYTIE